MKHLIKALKVLGVLVGIFVGTAIFAGIAESITNCGQKDTACLEEKQAKTQQKKDEAERIKREHEATEFAKKLKELPFYCAAAWEAKFQHVLRDPDSLSFDYHGVRHTAAKDGMWIVLVPYRAKNGFGGTNVKEAACAYDIATAKVLSVIQ